MTIAQDPADQQAGPDVAVERPRRTGMQVRKRNSWTEPVDVNKIVRAVERCADDLDDVDPLRVATKTIAAGSTTARPRPSWTGSRSRPRPR